jgi:hypothetical protein
VKQELQEKLYNKYPKLFYQKDLPMQQTCMCWGIECGNGWYTIIDNACRLLQHHVDNSRKEKARILRWNRMLRQAVNGNTTNLHRYFAKAYGEEKAEEEVKQQVFRRDFREVKETTPQLQFVQVKEKYGTLRLYTNYVDDYIDGVVNMAESMSAHTCEICGVPGKITGISWYHTLCRRCAKERNIDYDQKGGEEDE